MAIVKVINNQYYDYSTVQKVVSYVWDEAKVLNGLIASNLLYCDSVAGITEQMKDVAQELGMDKGRLIQHIVVSYDPFYENWVSPEMAFSHLRLCLKVYCPHFQWLAVVHNDKEQFDMHIVINNVDLVTGKKFATDYETLCELCFGFQCISIGGRNVCFRPVYSS